MSDKRAKSLSRLTQGRKKAVVRQKTVKKTHGIGSTKHKAAIATTKKYDENIKKHHREGAKRGIRGSGGPSFSPPPSSRKKK